jgi:SAM domain (Sterile alpha motif)
MRHCATVRLRRYTKQRSRSKVRARVVSAQCTEAVLDTLSRQDDDVQTLVWGAVMDIVVWLRSLGLGRYEAAFRDNEIDETVLPLAVLA